MKNHTVFRYFAVLVLDIQTSRSHQEENGTLIVITAKSNVPKIKKIFDIILTCKKIPINEYVALKKWGLSRCFVGCRFDYYFILFYFILASFRTSRHTDC